MPYMLNTRDASFKHYTLSTIESLLLPDYTNPKFPQGVQKTLSYVMDNSHALRALDAAKNLTKRFDIPFQPNNNSTENMVHTIAIVSTLFYLTCGIIWLICATPRIKAFREIKERTPLRFDRKGAGQFGILLLLVLPWPVSWLALGICVPVCRRLIANKRPDVSRLQEEGRAKSRPKEDADNESNTGESIELRTERRQVVEARREEEWFRYIN